MPEVIVPSVFTDDIVDAIYQIALRSEQTEDTNGLINSFYDDNLLKKLSNVNNQTIRGRRGTGKTHILRVLSSVLEGTNEHSIYIDCRLLGSAGSITNNSLDLPMRSTHIFRDFVHSIAQDLYNFYSWNNYPYHNYDEYILTKQNLDEIFHSCTEKSETSIEETHETEEKRLNHSNKEKSVNISTSATLANLFKKKEKSSGQERVSRNIWKGTSTDTIIFPNIAQNLNEITKNTNSRLYILLDEWSSIPLDIQPIFAEFLKRCILCCQLITVKIAVVPNRTQFIQKINGSVFGLETSSELSCAIDLDQMLTIDRDYRRVLRFMTELLVKHINTLLPNRNIKIEELSSGFEKPEVLIQLVRASEGNARDFLNILSNCLSGFDYSHMNERKITYFGVARAARDWFIYDKYAVLSSKQREHFEALFSFIVLDYHTRGGLIDERALSNPFISDLIDARILHVVSQGHINKHFNKGQRLALIVLDYGSFAEQLQQGQCLDLFLDDVLESMCRFPGSPKDISRNWWPYDERSIVACLIDIYEDEVLKLLFFGPEQ